MDKQRITLLKYIQEDYTNFKELVQNDELMFYILWRGLTEEETLTKFNTIIKTNEKESELGFFRVLNEEGTYLGHSKLEPHINDNSVIEIGYILKKENWRKGLGITICTKLLSLATKSYLNLDVIAIIVPKNLASRKLLEKFGFKSYSIGVEDDLPTEKLIFKRLDKNT